MPLLDNPPLIEAIFELRWGETSLGQFEYNENEALFAGMVSAAASFKGYTLAERIQKNPALPMFVSHRFRRQENSWPCYQIGLGVFTVNQTKDNYSWDSFKSAIQTGLEIFNLADPSKICAVKDSLSLILRYQDAFFPEQTESIEGYLDKHFNIKVSLPESFTTSDKLNSIHYSINFRVDIESRIPKGNVTITITNAIINDKPGLLMETVVHSKAKDIMENNTNINGILEWSAQAHDIQKHSFKTLISPSAYEVS